MIETALAATGVPALAEPLVFGMIVLVVIVGAILQSAIGMGFGLTAAPILALVDTALVPGPILVLGVVTASLAVIVDDGRVRWREVGLCTAGRLAGSVVAVALLMLITGRSSFNIVFGTTIVAAVLLSFAGWRVAFSVRNLIAMGSLSGLMGTITSVGAPPLAMIYQDHAAREARSTLSAFFAVGCVVSFAGAASAGWAGPRDFITAALLLPAVFAGVALSRVVKRHVDRRFRTALLVISGAAGLTLVLKGLF